jgi:hypothetical protein
MNPIAAGYVHVIDSGSFFLCPPVIKIKDKSGSSLYFLNILLFPHRVSCLHFYSKAPVYFAGAFLPAGVFNPC